jgi:DNA-binding CsgD family transcriptional regulator
VPVRPVRSPELAEVATSAAPLAQRAAAALEVLRRELPFDGAWLGLADPHAPGYSAVASADLDEKTLSFLAGPETARDTEATGTRRNSAPQGPSALPFPFAELPSWAVCPIPAGFHGALTVALLTPGGRPVGLLALLYGSKEPPSIATRRRLGGLTPALARAIDPLRSLTLTARLVTGGRAGVALHENGGTVVLPGLSDHPLLAAGSPVLPVARAALATGQRCSSFLWPLGGRHAPGGHARITALARCEDVPACLTGTVLVSPPGELHGLTPRELEILGLLVEGRSNAQIATELVVAQRTVAAHVEHVLVKLAASSRTLAAVRAERAGLYVPRPYPARPPRLPRPAR